jgi:ssDNA-binding Zn-finger/Zn-ribbon topoisomerase 1
MSSIQCEKCESAMRLQSESLTEEFWVCSNPSCNKWLRRSSIIHDANTKTGFGGSLFKLPKAVFSVFQS